MNSLTELNNYSALSVAYDDQGTGAQTLADRYQINGVIDTSQSVMSNIEKICNAAGSWLSYDIHEGKWGVVINNSGTSVASFNDTNILGSISLSGTGLTDLYNSVKVEFPHRELKDSADFVTIEIPDVDRNANEEDNTLNLSYDIINEPIQAQLLGFIELKQSRIDKVIKFNTDFSKVNLKAGNIIDVTNTRFNFNAKLFRIISISEIQDEDGALQAEITALEYDPDVYSTANLYRYTREDSNGIITIGSIGVPGTPQVTKFEIDSRPRIIVETTSPTGVVEGIEYWLTNDVNVAESLRSYRLIATRRPTGGGVFTSGTTVNLDYDALETSDFLIKTRGFNSTTVGPFSNPSGLVNFVAQQVTDAIGPNTSILDSAGGLVTLLAANYLLGQLGGLITGNVSSGSLIGSILTSITSATGINLSSGGIPTTPLTVSDEGVTISADTRKINFIGDLVTATIVGDVINVVIGQNNGGGGGGGGGGPLPGGITVTSVTPNSGPTSGGTNVTIIGTGFTGVSSVSFGGTTSSFTVVDATEISATTPAHSAGAVSVNVVGTPGTNLSNSLFTYYQANYLSVSAKYPFDRAYAQDPVNNIASDYAPATGSYYLVFGGQTFYGPLTKGTGNAYLYKSDGTLVQTLPAASLNINVNVVEFPFANRDFGTDYYILLDQGLIKYCDNISYAFDSPDYWNFNTLLYPRSPYTAPTPSNITNPTVYVPTLTSYYPTSSNICPDSNLSLTFSTSIIKGTGTATIYISATDTLVVTLNVADAILTGNGIYWATSLENYLVPGVAYYITVDAGIVLSNVGGDCYSTSNSPNAAITKASNKTFSTISPFVLSSFDVDSSESSSASNFEDTDSATNLKVNPQTNITLTFNRTPRFHTVGTLTLYKEDGSVHQVFDVSKDFTNNKVNELLYTSGSYSIVLNPTKDLSQGVTYYLHATPGVVRDSCNVAWSGLSNNNTVRFRIDPGPKASMAAVDDNSDSVDFVFDRTVVGSTGQIVIYDQQGNVVASLPSDDSSITYS
jgi:hypothetical protein